MGPVGDVRQSINYIEKKSQGYKSTYTRFITWWARTNYVFVSQTRHYI